MESNAKSGLLQKKYLKTIKESTDVFINNIMPNLLQIAFLLCYWGFTGVQYLMGLLDAGSKFVKYISTIYDSDLENIFSILFKENRPNIIHLQFLIY